MNHRTGMIRTEIAFGAAAGAKSVLFKKIEAFARLEGFRFLKQYELGFLRRFRESWSDSAITALKKLERLKAFLRFAHISGWIDQDPARHLKNPKIHHVPTMPYAQEQMIAILAACAELPDHYGKRGAESGKRARALVLLLRYSGMRIGDGAACAVDRLTGDRLFLYPKERRPGQREASAFVVEALQTMPKVSSKYFFWTGEGSKDTVAGNWRRTLRRVFKWAKIDRGHPHRFRDTYQ